MNFFNRFVYLVIFPLPPRPFCHFYREHFSENTNNHLFVASWCCKHNIDERGRSITRYNGTRDMLWENWRLLLWQANAVEDAVWVIPLDVSLQVPFLGEGVLAILTHKRPLPGMLLQVYLEMAIKLKIRFRYQITFLCKSAYKSFKKIIISMQWSRYFIVSVNIKAKR